MEKIKFYQKAEIVLLFLIGVLLLVWVFCIMADFTDYNKIIFIVIGVVGVAYWAVYLRNCYLIDNLPKEEAEKIAAEKNAGNYNNAIHYIFEEKCGHRSRFVRRFGNDVYEKFIESGIISCPSQKEWRITDYGIEVYNIVIEKDC